MNDDNENSNIDGIEQHHINKAFPDLVPDLGSEEVIYNVTHETAPGSRKLKLHAEEDDSRSSTTRDTDEVCPEQSSSSSAESQQQGPKDRQEMINAGLLNDDNKNSNSDGREQHPINKALSFLVAHLNPHPVLDLFQSANVISSVIARDIREEKTTSNTIRKLLQLVVRGGGDSYSFFKTCLHKSGQGDLCNLLECIERNENTDDLKERIHNQRCKQNGQLSAKVVELRRCLIEFNRENHGTIPISPLVPDQDVPLLDFYVQPPMEAVQRQYSIGPPTKTKINSYKQMLIHGEGNAYKYIYVTAKAGIGKTSFCKKLGLMWCQAHDYNATVEMKFKKEELLGIEALKRFNLFFFIPMRDIDPSLCDLDSFVVSLLNDHMQLDLESKHVKKILDTNSCLIVLDGLDEWVHPPLEICKKRKSDHDLPHKKIRHNCTILTTTRPWKFAAVQLLATQIDRQIEITELTENESNELLSNAVNKLNEAFQTTKTDKNTENFKKSLGSLHLEALCYIPYIFLQLVCLWYDGRDIGRTKCEIFTNATELTLEFGKRKLKQEHLIVITDSAAKLPVSFHRKRHEQCFNHRSLLGKIGRLSFDSLFNTEKRQMLVFDQDFVKEYLNEKEIDYCFRMGLLSRSKVSSIVSTRLINFSFQHKSIHEYFAALYIYFVETKQDERNRVLNTIKEYCNTLDSIVEMSNVFVFFSGFNPEMYKMIMKDLIHVVQTDPTTSKYRSTIDWYIRPSEYNMLYDFQTLQVDSVREMQGSAQMLQDQGTDQKFEALPVEDILLNEKSLQDEYLSLLKILVQGNKIIKALSLRECKNTEETTKVINTLSLKSLDSLAKIEIWVVPEKDDVECLLRQSKNTLNCIFIGLENFISHNYKPDMRSLNSSVDVLCDMPMLHAFHLRSVSISHESLRKLFTFIQSRTNLTQLGLTKVVCEEHEDSCEGFNADLSLHSSLKLFVMTDVPVSGLHINTMHLEECLIGHLPSTVTISYLNNLPLAEHLRRIGYRDVAPEVLPTLLKIIPELLRLEEINVFHASLQQGQHYFKLSPNMEKLGKVSLSDVEITTFVFQELLESLKHYRLPVVVTLRNCKITPETDYERLLQEIRESKDMEVLFDGKNSWEQIEFTFQTIKTDSEKSNEGNTASE